MRYGFVLALFISTGCQALEILGPGVNQHQLSSGSGKPIVVRVQVDPSKELACGGWRWGAEGDCPKYVVSSMEVLVAGDSLFIPRSAFADLGSPNRISFARRRSGLDILLRGGDAATSYVARLRFSEKQLISRKVTSGEFPDSAWEETRFSFTK